MRLVPVVVAALVAASSGCAATLHRRTASSGDAQACDALQRASNRDMWLAIGETAVGLVSGVAIASGAGPLDERPGRGEAVMFSVLAAAVLQAASADDGFKRAAACRGSREPLTAAR